MRRKILHATLEEQRINKTIMRHDHKPGSYATAHPVRRGRMLTSAATGANGRPSRRESIRRKTGISWGGDDGGSGAGA